jgi:PAS domain-containing protein
MTDADPTVSDPTLSITRAEADARLAAANRAADAQLAMLAALVGAIGLAVILLDREVRVAHWNKEASHITGIPMEQALVCEGYKSRRRSSKALRHEHRLTADPSPRR